MADAFAASPVAMGKAAVAVLVKQGTGRPPTPTDTVPVTACIYVLAGVSGAGKSSIGGALFAVSQVDCYNPDLVARSLLDASPVCRKPRPTPAPGKWGDAASCARWKPAAPIDDGRPSIQDLLMKGAVNGAAIHVWYTGLYGRLRISSASTNAVAAGGHPIAAAKIRETFRQQPKTLIRLLPYLATLRVYDNSENNDQSRAHDRRRCSSMENQRILASAARCHNGAKPIVMAAIRYDAAAYIGSLNDNWRG